MTVYFDPLTRNEDVRAKSANDLRDYVCQALLYLLLQRAGWVHVINITPPYPSQVIAVSREVSGETFSKFMNDVNRRIFELIQSNDVYDKIGGILAIGMSGNQIDLPL